MGLLDDAIREHLDLKRRSGGDPAEIERLEREALGPVRREPSSSVYTGPPAAAEARAPFEDEPLGAHADEMATSVHAPLAPDAPSTVLGGYEPETGEYAPHEDLPLHEEPAHEEPPKRRRFLRGLSALSGATTDEPEHDPLAHAEPEHDPLPHAEPEHDPLAHAEPEHDPLPHAEPEPEHDPLPHAARPEPPAAAPPRSQPPHLTLSGEHHEEEVEPEGAAPAPPAAPAAPAAPSDEQATQVHRAVTPDPDPDLEPFAEPPAAPEPAPAEDEADPLEETPEFLQDTPEHDRLWFEQRPPRDFDFDQ